MAVFDEIDWGRLDVQAIVLGTGLATIALADYPHYRAWLATEGYAIEMLDFRRGLADAIADFGSAMHWEQQFGYPLSREHCKLDALRDGFFASAPPVERRVFEMQRPDLGWLEDRSLIEGWLSIAAEHSRAELLLGRRFFTTLIVPGTSSLIGTAFETLCVPARWMPFSASP